jgi:uncharacterized protein with GYD domain
MPYFCHHVSYTSEAWARLLAHPQDRLEAIRKPVENLGGRVHTSYYAFGEFDVIAITEFPDNVSAAAIAMAFAAGGSLSRQQTTPLLTNAEALDAMKKAGDAGYRAVTAAAAVSSAHD